jgi:hypothetical protein
MKVVVWLLILAFAAGISAFAYIHRPAPEVAEIQPNSSVDDPADDPVQVSVADIHKVPDPKSDGTLVGEFGPIFPAGTIYDILNIEDVVYEGTKMKVAHIYLPKQSKILAVADGGVRLADKGDAVGLITSKIEVAVGTGYDSQIFVKHNTPVRRGDELMLSNGPCPGDKNSTVIVVFHPHGLGEASKEDREKAMDDFLELLKLGAVNPGGL